MTATLALAATPKLHLWPIPVGIVVAAAAGALVGLSDLRRSRPRVEVRGREPFFARVGRFAYRHPFVVLAFWVPVVVAGGIAAPRIAGVLSEGGLFVEGSDSLQAHTLLATSFSSRPDSTAFLVFTSSTLGPKDPHYQALVEEAVREARAVPGVMEVIAPGTFPGMVGKDGRTSYAVVGIRGESGQVVAAGRRLAALPVLRRPGPVRALMTGQAPLEAEFLDSSAEDLRKAERTGLPVAGLVLLIAFGTVVAASLPLVIAGAALTVGFGVLFLLAHLFQIGGIAESASTMIGLAVGIDYALFILTRYREELRGGAAREDAVATAFGTAGRAVAFSGTTVVLGLSGLLLVRVPYLRTMAAGPILVVMMSVLAAITLMPVALRAAGSWIDRLHIPRLPRLRRHSSAGGRSRQGFWVRWARAIMRRPVLFLLLSGGLLVAMASPTLSMALGNPGISSAPRSIPSRRGYEVLSRAFDAGLFGGIDVVVQVPGGVLTEPVATRIKRFDAALRGDRDVAVVHSYLDVMPDPATLRPPGAGFVVLSIPRARAALARFVNVDRGADVTSISVQPTVASDSPAAADLVKRIRTRYAPGTLGTAGVYVGGGPAESLDAQRALVASIPQVYGFIVLLSFVLLLVVFRSVLIPLKAILMNLLSVGAAFGVLVLVFQRGVLAGSLGVERLPFLDFVTPLIVFSTLFGLSMDYEVFLLSRIREEYLRRGDNETAVALGLETTGRTISAAALIMVVVFLAFVGTRMLAVKQIGLGLAVAVLVDATLVRVVLVPATMRLLGTWNWWVPRFLERVLPRIELEGIPEGPPGEGEEAMEFVGAAAGPNPGERGLLD